MTNSIKLTLLPATAEEHRVGDFPCPEGQKSARWCIRLSGSNTQLAEDYELDDDTLIFSSQLTATGPECTTVQGAIDSIKFHTSAVLSAVEEYNDLLRQQNVAADRWEKSGLIDIMDPSINDRADIGNELLAVYIKKLSKGQRTTFGIDELDTLDSYRNMLYGTLMLLLWLFNAHQSSAHYGCVMDGKEHDVSNYRLFESLSDLKEWVDALT